MTKDSKTPAAAAATSTPTPAPTPSAPEAPEAATVQPVVVAVHKVVYGPKQVALPGSMFRPNDAKQTDYLRRVGAVRDPNEAEAALAEKLVPALVETGGSTEGSVG